MIRQILPISALLLGSALLLFAGGMNGLILPLRGTLEGFGATALGLLGSGWAVGYVLGCMVMARLATSSRICFLNAEHPSWSICFEDGVRISLRLNCYKPMGSESWS